MFVLIFVPFVFRILKELSAGLVDPDLGEEKLKTLANKLFRGNHHLYDLFLSIIPQAHFPESLLPEPEIISLSPEPTDPDLITGETVELETENSDHLAQQQQISNSGQSFWHIFRSLGFKLDIFFCR